MTATRSKPPAQPEGLDFNRNFPFEWRTEGQQSGAGPYPASEPEIRAMVDFVASHPNINFAVTYHTFSRVILRRYSTKADDEMETQDLWVYKKIGEIGSQAHRLSLRLHLPRLQIPSQGSHHRRLRRLDVRPSWGICLHHRAVGSARRGRDQRAQIHRMVPRAPARAGFADPEMGR